MTSSYGGEEKEIGIKYSVLLLGLFFNPEDGGDVEWRWTSDRLNGLASQKIEIFITTVRT
jgi:hypothetical protein